MPGFNLLFCTQRAWKRHVKAWASPFAEHEEEVIKIPCSICGKPCHPRGLGVHQMREHHRIRTARRYCEADGISPVCRTGFGSRQRCSHHIHHSTSSCLAALDIGAYPPLSEERRIILDREDACVRKECKKAGISYLSSLF